MSNVEVIWNNAELAQASYAILQNGTNIDANLVALTSATGPVMSRKQAEKFIARYPTVVAQYDDSNNGSSFSATLFRNEPTRGLTLAIRGTLELTGTPNDLTTDLDIFNSGAGYDQIVAMANWWRKVSAAPGETVLQYELVQMPTAQVPIDAVVLRATSESVYVLRNAASVSATGELYSVLALDPDLRVDITGHSLGGHLAMAFSSLFPDVTGQVTVFNAPGFKSTDENRAFFEKLGGAIPAGDAILNVIADEAKVGQKPFRAIAGLYSRPGQAIDVPIENQWNSDEPAPFGSLNHSMTALVDTLAIYKLLSDLMQQPGLSEADYKTILNQAAQGSSASLERVVDTLKTLLGTEGTPLESGNGKREALYKALYDLRERTPYTKREQTLEIKPTPDDGAALLAHAQSSAADGLAYRYVLAALDPFVALGDGTIYEIHNQDSQLELYDATNRTGTLTAEWLQDRSAFLERKLYITSRNLDKNYQDRSTSDLNAFPNAPDARGNGYQLEAKHYQDFSSGFVASTGGPANPLQHVLFGGVASDQLRGAEREDRLYGGLGSDVLAGGYANDYLEGGAGMDVYEYTASSGLFGGNDGSDVIRDTDGKGVLRYSYTDGIQTTTVQTKVLAGAVFQRREGGWQSADGKFTYALQSADLAVTINGDAGGGLTLKDFKDGDFGIHQQRARTSPEAFVRTFVGDKEDVDGDPVGAGIQVVWDDFGNTVRDPDKEEVNRADFFYGAAGAEGEEFKTAGGNDAVYADGKDSITSDVGGDDRVETGAERDTVAAGGGGDWIEGGTGADILGGNAGDDSIYADASNGGTLTLQQAILAGETAQAVAGTGEVLSGDAGKDLLFAADTADLLYGGTEEDVVVGGGGNDTIYGDASLVSAQLDWTIIRTRLGEGIAVLYQVTTPSLAAAGSEAAGGADVIYGGTGDDWVFSGAGDDYVEGGEGSDAILGGGGNDVVLGGAGADFLDGDSTSSATAGLGGDDFLDGGDGDDQLLGESGNDILYGGAGKDVLSGGDGSDVLYGGTGDDILLGGAGKDTYVYNRGDGIDVIHDIPQDWNVPEASVLSLGADISSADIKLKLGSLLIDVGEGDAIHFNGFDTDDPWATPVLDSIQFADGSVMSYQEVLQRGFDIDGTDQGEYLSGTGVTDRIDAKGGDDFVDGKGGMDTIRGGDGKDVLQAGDGDDWVDGGSGDDYMGGGEGADFLVGADGSDTLLGGFGDDELNGGGGDDWLDGDEGADSISGGSGQDQILGGRGDDLLQGGGGDDFLSGNQGSDTYILSRGDGRDVLSEQAMIAVDMPDSGSTDVIRFSQGIARTDLSFIRRANGDLIIRYGVTDEVTVQGQYGNVENRIERFEFDDGSSIDQAELDALPVMPIEGTSGPDMLHGTSGNDVLLGYEGHDVLNGGPAPEQAAAGINATGNDVMEGGAGADKYLLYVGMGADTIVDGSASAEEQSTLTLAANLTLDALYTKRRNDDLLVGLRGRTDSVLIKGYYDGGSPQQNWQIEMPSGAALPMQELIDRPDPLDNQVALAAMEDYKQNVISEWKSLSRPLQWPTYGYVYSSWSQTITVTYGESINGYHVLPSTITVMPPVTEKQILGYGIKVDNTFVRIQPGEYRVQPVAIQWQTNDALVQTIGNPGITTTTESHKVSVLAHVGGDLHVATSAIGLTLNTVYSMSGQGWGVLHIDAPGDSDGILGVDTTTVTPVLEAITAGDGSNTIYGVLDDLDDHVALIDAGAGDDFIQAGSRDFAYGNAGDDTIVGGAIAYGGNGSDYISDAARQYGGSGNDTLAGGQYMAGGAGDDSLSGPDGVTTFFVDPAELGEDVIEDTGGISQAEFESWYYQSQGIVNAAEGVAFGGMWSVVGKTGDALLRRRNDGIDIGGTKNPYYDDAYLNHHEWPSTVYETLTELQEHLQAARVSYEPRDIRYIPQLPPAPQVSADDYVGLELLYEAGLLKPDALQFGGGITLDDVTVMRSADDTHVELTWGTGKSVAIRLAQPDDPIGAGVELIRFADGSTYDISYMLDVAQPFNGTPLDDVLDYTDSDDLASGLAGNDQMYTYAGNDTLSGGPGNDHLEGGSGDDVYLFERGDGADYVYDWAGDDTIRLGDGITPDDVSVTGDPYGALYIVVQNSDDRIALGYWDDPLSRVEHIEFADGTGWGSADLESRIMEPAATESGDVLNGTDGDDLIDGAGGNDLIFGLEGNDILIGGPGDDSIEEGGLGANLIDAGAGDDYVYEEGRTLVIGGMGNDDVDNYGDGAVIAFNAGDGHDTIYAANAFTLSLGAGISSADLTLSQEGDDLILAVGTGDTIRLTRQYEDDARAWPQIILQQIERGGVTTYDFNAVIEDYYAQRLDDGAEFSLEGVLQAHMVDTSAEQAIGGELAYQYARRGQVSALPAADIADVLNDPGFGTATQPVDAELDPILHGTPGDDVLTGTADADTLGGGAGNDMLDGGLGDDTYVFNAGDGMDRLADAGGVDTLSFGPGITPDTLELGLGSLLIRVGDAGAVHIEDFDPADAQGSGAIETFAFADGTTLTYEQLLARGFDLDGTTADDLITGTSVRDRIDGGAGNDRLDGGAGDDTYFFGRGGGRDRVDDSKGNDVIELGAGIAPDDLQVTRQDDELTVSVRGTADAVAIHWAPEAGHAVEALRFAGGTAWDAATLIDRINDAPLLAAAPADVSTLEDQLLRVEVPSMTFADPDAWGTVTYRASLADGSALPEWLAFDAATLTFSGLPGNNDVGSYTLRITATDQDGLSAEATFALAVVNVNDAPVVKTPIPDQAATEDEPTAFTIAADTFTDIDASDVLTFSASLPDGSPLPIWLNFDPATRSFSGMPDNGNVGTYALRVTATDTSGAATSSAFSLTVTNVNDPPELTAPLSDHVTYQNAPLAYAVQEHAFVDVDAGDTMTLSAALSDSAPLPAWLAFDAASGLFSGTPDETQAGAYPIVLAATDRSGAVATGTFELTVSDAGAYNTVQRGTKRDDVVRMGPGNDLIEVGKGDDIVVSGAGRDVVFGGEGDDSVSLGYGNDIGLGGEGRDRIDGGAGHDLLVGSEGADRLDGGAGNDVLVGGTGKDELYAGDGNNLVIGGPGGDTIYGGPAYDVFAFNRRDGKATLQLGDAAAQANRDTLSFGAGISAGDIVLRRSGKDLVVKIDDSGEEREDGNVSVVLKDWYGAGNHRSVTRLQFIGDRIELYDFTALAARFDAATRGKSTPWRAASTMQGMLLSTDSSEAIGGVLAHQYAAAGSLSAVALSSLQDAVSDARFARAPQTIANGDGDTLAPYFAANARDDDDDRHAVPDLPDDWRSWMPMHSGQPSGATESDDKDHDRSARDGSSGVCKPIDLQAILEATSAFAGDAGERHRTRESTSLTIPDSRDAVREIGAGVSSWALTNALLQFHLSASDTAMLGADMTHHTGRDGAFAGISLPAAEIAIGAPGFGREAHALKAFSGLQEGLARLA